VSGVGSYCHVANFADPISIKAVSYGEVEWRLDHRRYLIQPDTLLLLPDGDEYSLTIDSAAPTSGFCAVFRRGLVEECWRVAVSKPETLLDSPHDLRPLSLPRRLESRTGPFGRALDAIAAAVQPRHHRILWAGCSSRWARLPHVTACRRRRWHGHPEVYRKCIDERIYAVPAISIRVRVR
jgi:hypothetical protein